jgi:DUF1680 family protein
MTMTTTTTTTIAPVVPTRGALRPLGLDEVRIASGFWADRQEVNRAATLPHIEHWLEREGWLGNFDRAAAGTLPEGRRGREFSDSEVYKYLEAVAWELGRSDSPELEERFRAVVRRIAAAQEPDGYLNTRFGRPGQKPRWSDLEWGHELYCLGHLFQAAVARARTRPDADDGLIEVARRAADLVCEVFGENGIPAVCGHPEIEVGLAELARVTGESRYLEQAQRFIDRRGHGALHPIEWGSGYFQDDVPIRETEALHGHAVRANYLAAAAVDVAVETGEDGLLDALRRQWDRTVARRTYITGGQGSHHQDEAFGDDFELPPDRAYSETCAGVGSVMFSWRLLLATGEARYADLIERTLYNVVATSPSHDGRAFFYANTLHQREAGAPVDPDVISSRAESSLRAPWFEVSCCPPNVARTLASIAALLATVDATGVQLHQFAEAEIRTRLADGRGVALAVETAYPRDGVVRVRVLDAPGDPWSIAVRVPAWATGAEAVLTTARGERMLDPHPGYLTVTESFAPGDTIELRLPVEPRVVVADPRIDAVRGCVAIERGPEVLCLESPDLPEGVRLDELAFDPEAGFADADGRVTAEFVVRASDDRAWPYAAREASEDRARSRIPLIPYHDWAERGPATMRVWIPLADES